MNKFTKIGATIGPACQRTSDIVKMIEAGMNYARLNFSHGDHKSHSVLIKNLRIAAKKTGHPLAIMGDVRGPRIRLGDLGSECARVKTGQTLEFALNKISNSSDRFIPVDAPVSLLKFLRIGHAILIDDGQVEIKIIKMRTTGFTARVTEGGALCSHKGLNFPDSDLDIPPVSDKDKFDLEFCVKQEVDFIALSFVKDGKDIENARHLIGEYAKRLKIKNPQPIKLIAKMERHEAMVNIDSIIEAADGIMVARGDLGLELRPAEVPLAQKEIISKANAVGKPVIVATQMLDSMKEKKRPTRAEVSDVANAVIDHADALLLTNETAAGAHPVLVVQTMADIIKATEASSYDDKNLLSDIKIDSQHDNLDKSISEVSRLLADDVGAKLILAASLTGETGRLISRARPSVPILVATGNLRAWRQLNLSWGVSPFILPTCKTIEELVKKSVSYIKKNKIAKSGDEMIIVAGEPVGKAGNVNLVEVRRLK